MFESTKMQTKLRTNELEPNDNISFPIGTIFLVDKLYEVLNFTIFSGNTRRGYRYQKSASSPNQLRINV